MSDIYSYTSTILVSIGLIFNFRDTFLSKFSIIMNLAISVKTITKLNFNNFLKVVYKKPSVKLRSTAPVGPR